MSTTNYDKLFKNACRKIVRTILTQIVRDSAYRNESSPTVNAEFRKEFVDLAVSNFQTVYKDFVNSIASNDANTNVPLHVIEPSIPMVFKSGVNESSTHCISVSHNKLTNASKSGNRSSPLQIQGDSAFISDGTIETTETPSKRQHANGTDDGPSKKKPKLNFDCALCSYRTSKRHVQDEHPQHCEFCCRYIDVTPTHYCFNCKRSFPDAKRFRCNICRKQFKNKIQLEQHLRRVHKAIQN